MEDEACHLLSYQKIPGKAGGKGNHEKLRSYGPML